MSAPTHELLKPIVSPQSSSLDQERQQSEVTPPLDRLRQLALFAGGNRGDAARHDLAALGDVALQELDVLVVDLRRVGAGERTGLAATKERPPGRDLRKAHEPHSSAAS